MISVENDNSTDEKDKTGRMIVAISTKEITKPNESGNMKFGK